MRVREVYIILHRDIDGHWTSLYDQLSVSDSYILFTSLSITRYINININIYTYTYPSQNDRPNKDRRRHNVSIFSFPIDFCNPPSLEIPPKEYILTNTAQKKSKNPTGATGALTGKDSAVGGLTGGRKPGPVNNRSDDDENSVS